MRLETFTVLIPQANTAQILYGPAAEDCDISITCGFGVAAVLIGTRENAPLDAWAQLPAVGEYDKRLGAGQALYVRSDIANTRVPVVVGIP